MNSPSFLNELTRILPWIYSDSSINSLRFLNEFTRIPQWIQQIVLNSSMSSFEFFNEFIQIHKQINLNSSTNWYEFIIKLINEFICIHLQILFNISADPFKIFTNFHSFLLFGCFEKIINEFTNEFIELSLRLKSFFNFSHFAKLFIKFFKS